MYSDKVWLLLVSCRQIYFEELDLKVNDDEDQLPTLKAVGLQHHIHESGEELLFDLEWPVSYVYQYCQVQNKTGIRKASFLCASRDVGRVFSSITALMQLHLRVWFEDQTERIYSTLQKFPHPLVLSTFCSLFAASSRLLAELQFM